MRGNVTEKKTNKKTEKKGEKRECGGAEDGRQKQNKKRRTHKQPVNKATHLFEHQPARYLGVPVM